MARGKGRKRQPQKRGKQHGRPKPNTKKNKSTNGRDIKHRDQFKRPLPEELEAENAKRRKKEEVSSDESEEEQDAYKQLLSTFTGKETNHAAAVESDDEVSDEEESLNSENESDDELPNLSSGVGNESEAEENELNSVADEDESGDSSNEGDSAADDNDAEDDDNSGSDSASADSYEGDDASDAAVEAYVAGNAEEDDEGDVEGDPFTAHISLDLTDNAVEILTQPKPSLSHHELNWKNLGRLVVTIPDISEISPTSNGSVSKIILDEPKKYAQPGKVPVRISEVDWNQLYVKTQIRDRIAKANAAVLLESGDESSALTPLQLELFTVMNNYQDLYYPERILKRSEEVRLAYCLHAANHVMKTRNAVLHHNARLNKKNREDVPDEFRDQGLVRPKVLILVPFREQARRVVEMLINLLVPDNAKGGVMNRKRFEEEFTGGELAMPKKNPKPEDYEVTFAGNTDDTFRLGLTLTKKCLKLYADFYSADIIVSSPLGLRMIVGAEGESERDYDFLASIELLILDQADIFLMQNWDHLLHVWDHLHLQPRESHGTDFSRVRSWAASGWSKHYRQTVLLSSIALPEFSALLSKRCNNYAGSVRVVNPITRGTICHVVVQLPQVFQRVEASSVPQSLDARFEYLTKKVIPDHSDAFMGHTMIFVPSYFDFVRVRNYLRKQDTSFVQVCEYSKEGKVARARDMFYHSQVQFLLYSERFHFFRRTCIKGIRHIVFYQPPTIPHFYSEMCNLMQEGNQNPRGGSESNMTVTVLYSKYDAPQLAAIVGTERASRMLSTDRNVHMFMTGE